MILEKREGTIKIKRDDYFDFSSDFEDEGESIFTRKKPLVDATLERIYAGLVKFVAKGELYIMLVY